MYSCGDLQTCVWLDCEYRHKRNVSRRSNVMKWIWKLQMCVMCNCVQCDVCQWSLCGVGCRKGGSGFIMGPSLWALACCQQTQMPLTGCWFSRWSLEVAAEHRGHIGAHINHRIWLVLLWLISTCLQWARALSNKAEILLPRARNSLASSDRPESRQTTTKIDIFHVSFASLMFVRHITVPPSKKQSPGLFHSCAFLLHSHIHRQTGGHRPRRAEIIAVGPHAL